MFIKNEEELKNKSDGYKEGYHQGIRDYNHEEIERLEKECKKENIKKHKESIIRLIGASGILIAFITLGIKRNTGTK